MLPFLLWYHRDGGKANKMVKPERIDGMIGLSENKKRGRI